MWWRQKIIGKDMENQKEELAHAVVKIFFREILKNCLTKIYKHILIFSLYFSHVIKFVLDCDWQCYLDRYSDLQKAFGPNNVVAAENHWKGHGKSEGRTCTCGSENFFSGNFEKLLNKNI